MKNFKLMEMATVFTFGLLYMMMFVTIPEKNQQIFQAIAMLLIGFFFGATFTKSKETGNEKLDTPVIS